MITEKTVRLLKKIYTVSFDNLIDSRYNAFGVYHASLGRISSHRSEHFLPLLSGEMDYFKYFKTVLRDRTVYSSL
jgi:hypothetical protein